MTTDDAESGVRPREPARCGHRTGQRVSYSAVRLMPLERRVGAQRWGMVCSVCGEVTDTLWMPAPLQCHLAMGLLLN